MHPNEVKRERMRQKQAVDRENVKIIALIDEIDEREVGALTKPQIAFLKARISYLNEVQLKKFAPALKKKVVPDKPVVDPNKKSYKELQARAKELGLPFRNVKKEELEVAISTVEGPEGAPKPQ